MWWRTLLMVSLFKAQLVIDWSQTTTWRTTHCMRWGVSLMTDTHARHKQQLQLFLFMRLLVTYWEKSDKTARLRRHAQTAWLALASVHTYAHAIARACQRETRARSLASQTLTEGSATWGNLVHLAWNILGNPEIFREIWKSPLKSGNLLEIFVEIPYITGGFPKVILLRMRINLGVVLALRLVDLRTPGNAFLQLRMRKTNLEISIYGNRKSCWKSWNPSFI